VYVYFGLSMQANPKYMNGENKHLETQICVLNYWNWGTILKSNIDVLEESNQFI
jgi:hypothetical protein